MWRCSVDKGRDDGDSMVDLWARRWYTAHGERIVDRRRDDGSPVGMRRGSVHGARNDGTPTGRRDQGVWMREGAMVACWGRGPRSVNGGTDDVVSTEERAKQRG